MSLVHHHRPEAEPERREAEAVVRREAEAEAL
jgi:hypothetical protein